MAGRDGDPMELYQVFQSSYNKIAKTDYVSSAESSTAFTSPDMYAADSRFFPFPFDTRPAATAADGGASKSDKSDMVDPRQWYTDPSAAMYSDPALSYYHTGPPDLEWGSGVAAPTTAYHPHVHYSPDPAAYAAPPTVVGGFGSSAPTAAVSPPAVLSSPEQYNRGAGPPLDDAINVFRNHLEFQV